MIDIAAFVTRCRGMILQPDATLREHAQPLPPWQVAGREHALPLVVISAVVSTVLIWLFPPQLPGIGVLVFSLDTLLLQLALETAAGFIGILVVAGVIMIFSGMFGGRSAFGASFVLATLAATPYYLGKALVPLPMIGMLTWFAGLIYSLVLLYKGSGVVLLVPAQNRGKQFALSLISLLLIAMMLFMALGHWVQVAVGSAE